MDKTINQILKGLSVIFVAIIFMAGVTAMLVLSVMPMVAVDMGYTPWVLLAYVPVLLMAAWSIGAAK
jgi:hypothetical protein